MKWQIAIPVLVTVAPVTRAGDAAPPPTPERDLGAEVRRVFAAKCAACHGPELAKPKGRFGYVLDLKRVASNPEMVVPSRPDESELWVLIGRNEMPPPDSPHGPLSVGEKETVRAWIAAGSPDAQVPSAANSDAPEPSPPRVRAPDRAIRWFGRFHLLALHFPIALMIAAGVGELVSVWRGSRGPSPAVQFCVLLAALAVIPTVILGWLHAAAGSGAGSPPLLTAHRWVGTIAGIWVVGTACGAARDVRGGRRSRGVRVALAIGTVLVVGTAHFGGLMAHGRDYFDW
ncbi:c-type cytochrome domain-containing protein [Frigoriglobus tundricola]|uniref:Cytochrome C Planctomycete-type domain-containing protein n=1 Tax=Frigoriglobus tundricola TaxID=2774151 RepID=A0A6M5YKA0_9BACT|nr:c-type cytochrome domain-containing protein [Frigoriglobus tundricola]QJW94385.1 hypothetical protein FTUN_1905 [Frigoriglobus tundricola]